MMRNCPKLEIYMTANDCKWQIYMNPYMHHLLSFKWSFHVINKNAISGHFGMLEVLQGHFPSFVVIYICHLRLFGHFPSFAEVCSCLWSYIGKIRNPTKENAYGHFVPDTIQLFNEITPIGRFENNMALSDLFQPAIFGAQLNLLKTRNI